MTIELRESAATPAAPEEVWKLLYDPARFASWWEGVDATEPDGDDGLLLHVGDGSVLPQRLQTDAHAARVTVSCLVTGLEFRWSLAPLADGGTEITAECGVPEREAGRVEAQRAALATSLRRLAALAATDAPPGRG